MANINYKLVFGVVMCVCLIFGCLCCTSPNTEDSSSIVVTKPTTKTTTTLLKQQVTTSRYSPTNIETFSSTKEGEMIRFYFLLEDVEGRNTPADGHVKIEIFDSMNNSLYNKEFDVQASEFVDYQFKLTGKGIGKAYEWRAQISEIKKGISSLGSWGRAVLIFSTINGKQLHAEDTTFSIPTYTKEELDQMAEEEYEKSAISVNKKISKGSFEVTVIKAGFFSKYEWGEKKMYFRVDMEAKNIGGESEYFSPSGMAVVDTNGNQYENAYGGTLDTFTKLYPGITKKGYILFEDVPPSLTSAKMMFELGHDEDYNPYTFEYNLG